MSIRPSPFKGRKALRPGFTPVPGDRVVASRAGPLAIDKTSIGRGNWRTHFTGTVEGREGAATRILFDEPEHGPFTHGDDDGTVLIGPLDESPDPLDDEVVDSHEARTGEKAWDPKEGDRVRHVMGTNGYIYRTSETAGDRQYHVIWDGAPNAAVPYTSAELLPAQGGYADVEEKAWRPKVGDRVRSSTGYSETGEVVGYHQGDGIGNGEMYTVRFVDNHGEIDTYHEPNDLLPAQGGYADVEEKDFPPDLQQGERVRYSPDFTKEDVQNWADARTHPASQYQGVDEFDMHREIETDGYEAVVQRHNDRGSVEGLYEQETDPYGNRVHNIVADTPDPSDRYLLDRRYDDSIGSIRRVADKAHRVIRHKPENGDGQITTERHSHTSKEGPPQTSTRRGGFQELANEQFDARMSDDTFEIVDDKAIRLQRTGRDDGRGSKEPNTYLAVDDETGRVYPTPRLTPDRTGPERGRSTGNAAARLTGTDFIDETGDTYDTHEDDKALRLQREGYPSADGQKLPSVYLITDDSGKVVRESGFKEGEDPSSEVPLKRARQTARKLSAQNNEQFIDETGSKDYHPPGWRPRVGDRIMRNVDGNEFPGTVDRSETNQSGWNNYRFTDHDDQKYWLDDDNSGSIRLEADGNLDSPNDDTYNVSSTYAEGDHGVLADSLEDSGYSEHAERVRKDPHLAQVTAESIAARKKAMSVMDPTRGGALVGAPAKRKKPTTEQSPPYSKRMKSLRAKWKGNREVRTSQRFDVNDQGKRDDDHEGTRRHFVDVVNLDDPYEEDLTVSVDDTAEEAAENAAHERNVQTRYGHTVKYLPNYSRKSSPSDRDNLLSALGSGDHTAMNALHDWHQDNPGHPQERDVERLRSYVNEGYEGEQEDWTKPEDFNATPGKRGEWEHPLTSVYNETSEQRASVRARSAYNHLTETPPKKNDLVHAEVRDRNDNLLNTYSGRLTQEENNEANTNPVVHGTQYRAGFLHAPSQISNHASAYLKRTEEQPNPTDGKSFRRKHLPNYGKKDAVLGLEPKFTGTVKDRQGRTVCFREGKRTPCPKKPKDEPKKPGQRFEPGTQPQTPGGPDQLQDRKLAQEFGEEGFLIRKDTPVENSAIECEWYTLEGVLKVYQWCSSPNLIALNTVLRSGTEPKPGDIATHSRLQRAFEQTPLAQAQVYRGVDLTFSAELAQMLIEQCNTSMATGEPILLAGYTPCTLRDDARFFSKFRMCLTVNNAMLTGNDEALLNDQTMIVVTDLIEVEEGWDIIGVQVEPLPEEGEMGEGQQEPSGPTDAPMPQEGKAFQMPPEGSPASLDSERRPRDEETLQFIHGRMNDPKTVSGEFSERQRRRPLGRQDLRNRGWLPEDVQTLPDAKEQAAIDAYAAHRREFERSRQAASEVDNG